MVEPRSDWALVHNPAFLHRIDANHAGFFRGAAGTGPAIAEEIIACFEAYGATPAAYVDVLATPQDLVPALLCAGFQEWTAAANDLLLYVGPDRERPASHHVAPVTTAHERDTWAAIQDEADADSREQLVRLHAREIGDPRVTAYLAVLDGQPAARGHLFSADGLGRVEAVHTVAAYRGRGLAAAIVRRAVQDSLACGNELTYIYAEPDSAAQRLYTHLGFRVVAPKAIRGFLR
jgi:GNAT superfamily N-acetyltransferase